MAASKLNKYGTLIIILLIPITVIGTIAWLRYSPDQPVEITLPPDQEWQGVISISGAVSNPGLYPYTGEESIESLVQAAGGATGDTDLNELRLHITGAGEGGPQKVDINRAEVWLLESLPGIGEILAQRIIDYRCQNGPFQNISELLKVAGVGNTIYERIKDLITVAD